MYIPFSFTVLLFGILSSVTGQTNSSLFGTFEYQYTHTVVSGYFDKLKISWALLDDKVAFKFESTKEGYIGAGFNPGDGGMEDCDMAVATIENGLVVVSDYWSTGYETPRYDDSLGGVNSIIAYQGKIENGKTTMEFIRPLAALDKYDSTIDPSGLLLVYAVASVPTPRTEHDWYGNIHINLNKNHVYADKLHATHAILMVLCYAGLMVFGIFIARFFKHLGKPWFYTHIGLQSVAVAGIIVAVIIAFVMSAKHFYSLHSIIGIIAVAMTITQPILGVIADRMWEEGRLKTPIFPDMVHWWIGYANLILAFWAIFLGIVLLGVTYKYLYAFAAWVGFVIIVYIVCAILRPKRDHDVDHKDEEMK